MHAGCEVHNTSQVLAIRFMFRHGAKDPLNITTNGFGHNANPLLLRPHHRRPLQYSHD